MESVELIKRFWKRGATTTPVISRYFKSAFGTYQLTAGTLCHFPNHAPLQTLYIYICICICVYLFVFIYIYIHMYI